MIMTYLSPLSVLHHAYVRSEVVPRQASLSPISPNNNEYRNSVCLFLTAQIRERFE